jgi:hypothetical protein
MVSYKANFHQVGSAGSPVQFSCFLENNGSEFSQATAVDIDAYYPSINGQSALRILSGTNLKAFCGVNTGAAWTFASYPLQVTFVRLAGEVTGDLESTNVVESHHSLAAGGIGSRH